MNLRIDFEGLFWNGMNDYSKYGYKKDEERLKVP